MGCVVSFTLCHFTPKSAPPPPPVRDSVWGWVGARADLELLEEGYASRALPGVEL
jgi:hypothetical protein